MTVAPAVVADPRLLVERLAWASTRMGADTDQAVFDGAVNEVCRTLRGPVYDVEFRAAAAGIFGGLVTVIAATIALTDNRDAYLASHGRPQTVEQADWCKGTLLADRKDYVERLVGLT